jgi:tripartite-type tricarboxylate transporter receptor subunit TctC
MLRNFLGVIGGSWLGLGCMAVLAQGMAPVYPTRAITLIVPFSASTGPDIMARMIGPRLSERWGQGVVVDNRPGASGNIGAEALARARPDGHTLMIHASTLTITPALYRNLPYDVARDFAPITRLSSGSFVLAVNPNSLPVSNMAEFVSLVRASPGRYHYSTPGNATPHHLGMELIKQRLGLDIVHVPYKGAAPAVTDLVGGQVEMMLSLAHTILPQARGGKLRMIGITGRNRSPLVPEAATFREQGQSFMEDLDSWYGLFAPAGTPPELIARIGNEVKAILALPESREQLARQGMVVNTNTPEELSASIRADLQRWAKLIGDAKIKAD